MKWKLTTAGGEPFALRRFLDADGAKSQDYRLTLTNDSKYFAEGVEIRMEGEGGLGENEADLKAGGKQLKLGNIGPGNHQVFYLRFQPKPKLDAGGKPVPSEAEVSLLISCSEWTGP